MAKHAHAPKQAKSSPAGKSSGGGGGRSHPAKGAGSHGAGAASVRPEAPPDPNKGPRHEVREGETLWDIAESHLGDGSLWPRIWAMNKGRVPNPSVLHTGVSLVMPSAGPGAAKAGGKGKAAPAAKAKAHTPHAKAHTPHAKKKDGSPGNKTTKLHSHKKKGMAPAMPKGKNPHAEHKDGMEGGLRRPAGLHDILRVFGKPGTNIISKAMRCGPGGKMTTVSCHAKVAGVLAGVFDDIFSAGLSEHINTFDGCYNYRSKRGGSEMSTHAWGIAVDVNASANPMTSSKKGKTISYDQKVLAPFFQKRGFVWGAAFNDAMHFQYCSGY